MDEGLIVLRTDGSVQAFDSGAERALGLEVGTLRIGTDLGSLIGSAMVARLFDAAPTSGPGEALGSGELSFERCGQWITARATRLSASISEQPCVLLRLNAFGALPAGLGRDLAARLSRELRSPVATIRGCSQTLLRGALEDAERARRFIEMMDHHVDRLELMADDLDALAHIEPDWIRGNRRAVDVRPVLGCMARSHAGSMIRRGVSVRAVPPSDDVVVAAVPQLFERSLLGVVDELVRFARRGEEVVCAAARQVSPSGKSPQIAEIAVERRASVANGAEPPVECDGESATLRMETVRDVVRSHGGSLSTRGTGGRLDAVSMLWPLWSPACEAPRAA